MLRRRIGGRGNLLAMACSAMSRLWASLPCIRRRVMGAGGSLGVHLMVKLEPAGMTSWLVGAVRTLKPGI